MVWLAVAVFSLTSFYHYRYGYPGFPISQAPEAAILIEAENGQGLVPWGLASSGPPRFTNSRFATTHEPRIGINKQGNTHWFPAVAAVAVSSSSSRRRRSSSLSR